MTRMLNVSGCEAQGPAPAGSDRANGAKLTEDAILDVELGVGKALCPQGAENSLRRHALVESGPVEGHQLAGVAIGSQQARGKRHQMLQI